MEEFKLSKFTKEGAELLREVIDEFNRLGLDTSRLPKTFPDDSGKIKLVFVGQYSAGKSSIIKMLTGEDVAIGAAITTQDSTPYEWNGLEIIDTPGIHTELRPDHDEITYEQIHHAALLIFVITNEGFSQRMGDHFRELAIKQKRAANMVLVVNKMDRTALGNVPEQQQVIYEDLKKVTRPHDPKELYISFVDTASYFKALEETEERRRNRRLERSGREVFIANLNRFVADKGVLQKINLPLNTLAAELRKIVATPTSKDSDVKALIEADTTRKEILIDGKEKCQSDIDDIIANFECEIASLGRETADAALNSGDNKKAGKILTAANEKVDALSKTYSEKIFNRIKESLEGIDKTLSTYDDSVFVTQVNENISFRLDEEISSGSLIPGGLGSILGIAVWQKGAQLAAPYAIQKTIEVATFATKFTPLVEKGVTAVATAFEFNPIAGHIAGKGAGFLWRRVTTTTVTLPPTATNRIAQFITNNAGKIGAAIGILGAAWTIYSMIKGAEEQRKREAEQRKAKNDIISNFEKVGKDIGEQLKTSAKNFLEDNINPVIAKCDNEIQTIETNIAKSELANKKLSALLTRTEKLIGELQAD